MRVLVLGGTGAMGLHVCEGLVARGDEVVCTTRRPRPPALGVEYAVGDAHDPDFLDRVLSRRWDAVVDFMIWGTAAFREVSTKFLASTEQYVFISSYRVYADSPVIREGSPRLLDVVDDPEYLATDEYALCKARCEDVLFGSEGENWTIVRPAVTYDGAVGRLQLGVFEASDWLWRAVCGIPVPMPGEMLERQATMSAGKDVAEAIVCLVGNSCAMGEAFTVSGSDHMTWGEVADVYRGVLSSLEIAPCSLDEFERVRGGIYQIRYDRMFDRVVDNSKVLAATGMARESFRRMRDGLAPALAECLSRPVSLPAFGLQGRFDRLCGGFPAFAPVLRAGGFPAVLKYLARRLL